MTASKIYRYIHGNGYPGLRSGKSGLLERKGGHSRLGGRHSRVSTPRDFDSCGALCTYSLYELQASEWKCVANGTVHQAISRLKPLNR